MSIRSTFWNRLSWSVSAVIVGRLPMLAIYTGLPHHLVATNERPLCVAKARTRGRAESGDRMDDVGGFYVRPGESSPAIRHREEWTDERALSGASLCKKCRNR